jgi:Xaa-Pro aminopeptidase
MTSQELFQIRQALLQTYLRERGYDGVLLSRADNFAMATGVYGALIAWTVAGLGMLMLALVFQKRLARAHAAG